MGALVQSISVGFFQSIKGLSATDSGPFLPQFPTENAKQACKGCHEHEHEHEHEDMLHLMKCYQKSLGDD